MDEFLVAIMSGIALVLYTIFTFLLFRYKWKYYVRWGLVIFIILLLVFHSAKRKSEKKRWRKMNLDEETYLFYNKYTSWSNRVSFVFTYLLQDFIYVVKTTNKSYNFSKGMFRYDDSLGEYYIDCRLAWYAYMKKNLLKNRLSLNKLRIYSLTKCNHMILDVYTDQKEDFEAVKKAWEEQVNELPAKKKPKKRILKKLEGADKLDKLLISNLYEMEVSRKFMMDNKESYQEMMKKADKRKEDLREIKNFQVDLNEAEKNR